MPHDQREKGILAESQNYNEQDTDRKSGYHFRIHYRNLIDKINGSSGSFFTVKGSDGSDGSQNRRNAGRPNSQRKGAANHSQQLTCRKQGFIILQGKISMGSDGCRIRKAVYSQNQYWKIHK